MSKSSENVKCVYCNNVLKKKNLKEHTKNVHGSQVKVDFVSVLSSDIRTLFTGPPAKVSKSSDRVDPPITESDENNQTAAILSQLESLHLMVDQLEKQNTPQLSSILPN